MPRNDLTYLGILAAPTREGKRVVAVALSGGAELCHFADAGLDCSSEAVQDWLWAAGINPDEAATALPPEILIKEVLVPAIGSRALVVHHGDREIAFVDQLITALADAGNVVITSGLELIAPIEEAPNGAAGRRAFALQTRYEAALADARKSPLIHLIGGSVENGRLVAITVDGPFAKQSWTLENDEDAFFVMTHLSHLGPLTAFVIEKGPGKTELKRLANELGLGEKLAA